MTRGEHSADRPSQQERALQTVHDIIDSPMREGYEMIDFSELLPAPAPAAENGEDAATHFLYAVAAYKPPVFTALQTKNEPYGLWETKYVNRVVRDLSDHGAFEGLLYNALLQLNPGIQNEIYDLSRLDVAIHADKTFDLPQELPVGLIALLSGQEPQPEDEIAIDRLRVYFPHGFSLSMVLREFIANRRLSYSFN